MSDIRITMLGKFDITVDGVSILFGIGSSPKSKLLLKYLILSRKPVEIKDLIELFWSESEKGGNPENALKTMVSRLRANLAKASPTFKDCILSTKKRCYVWNTDIPCVVDAFLFERLCGEIGRPASLSPGLRRKFIEILDIYAGDLLDSGAEEEWLVSRSVYLHGLYLETVVRFIELLKAARDFDTIIYVCRMALDIDPFDETLNLELMNALKSGGQNNAALLQYRHVTSVYNRYLGVELSEKIIDFYHNLQKYETAVQSDITAIRKGLREVVEENNGVLICDYSIFKNIYQLQQRSLERQENKMFLCLLGVSRQNGEPFEPLLLEDTMKELLEILRGCLREGDTVSRYSASQYAILLPMMSQSNGQIVTNRIRTLFNEKHADSQVEFSFQVEGVERG